MPTIRNLAGRFSRPTSNPVKSRYNTFNTNLEIAVARGKLSEVDAVTHMTKLDTLAKENKTDEIHKYIDEHSEKLGFNKDPKFYVQPKSNTTQGRNEGFSKQ